MPGSSFIWLDVSPMKQAEAIITILQMSKLRHRYKAKVVEFMFFKTCYSNTEGILHKIWRKHRSQVTAGQSKKEKGGPCLTEGRAFSHRTSRRPWPLSDHAPQAGLRSHTLTEGRGQSASGRQKCQLPTLVDGRLHRPDPCCEFQSWGQLPPKAQCLAEG